MLSKEFNLDCHVYKFGIKRKRESMRQANEAQREKGRQRFRARHKKQRRHFLLEELRANFVAAGDKMRNASGHQYKVKMRGSEKK